MRITHFTVAGVFLECASGCSIQNNYIDAFAAPESDGITTNPGAGNPSIPVRFACNQFIRNQVISCHRGIASFGGNYLESNFVSNCEFGLVMSFQEKYRFNTTAFCATPIINGIPLTDGNN
jgi:hypothetical protein